MLTEEAFYEGKKKSKQTNKQTKLFEATKAKKVNSQPSHLWIKNLVTMITGQKAANRRESREVGQLLNVLSSAAKAKHKGKILQENPEVLFTDYTQHKDGRKKNNLIFFTGKIMVQENEANLELKHSPC